MNPTKTRSVRNRTVNTLASLLALAVFFAFAESGFAQGAITNGQNHVGEISSAGETDEWTFVAEAGKRIDVTLSEGAVDTAFSPKIEVTGPDDTVLISNTGALVTGGAAVTALEGIHKIKVSANAESGAGSTGTYTLRFTILPDSFVVPSGDEGGEIIAGDIKAASINEPGDVDIWRFSATEGENVTVEVTRTSGSFTLFAILSTPENDPPFLLNPDAISINYPSAVGGVYYLRIAAGGDGISTGNYTISLNGATEPQPLDISSIAFTPDHTAAFSFEVEAGKTYQLQRSTDLDEWSDVGDPFTADKTETIQLSELETSSVFYRAQDVTP